jgi:hypothetical protein
VGDFEAGGGTEAENGADDAVEAAKEECGSTRGGGGDDQERVNAQEEGSETQHKDQGRRWAWQVLQTTEIVVAFGRRSRRRRIVAGVDGVTRCGCGLGGGPWLRALVHPDAGVVVGKVGKGQRGC